MAIKASNQITIVDVTDAYSALLSSESFTFIGNTTGAPSGLFCTTQVTAYCGSQQCSKISVSTIKCPSGISAMISDNDTSSPIITFMTTDTIVESCEATIPIVVDEITISKKFSFAVAKQGSDGADGKGIKSTEISYQISESGTAIPAEEWTEAIPETTPEKPYLWTRTIITYTDDTDSVSYSVSSTLDGINIGGRNLINEYNFTLTSVSSKTGISATDDRNGNIVIISNNEITISDDGNGNIALTSFPGTKAINDGNGNIAIEIANDDSTGNESSRSFKMFIVDTEDANEITVAVNAAYGGSDISTRTGVYTVSAYNVENDGKIGSIFVSEVNCDIDGERHSCIMSISEKARSNVAVRIGMSNADASRAGTAVNFSNLKIEKGNQATDWTPSPKDTEDAISDIRNDITSQRTDILSSCESIILSALETYVESGEYDEFKQTVSSQLEVLANRITMTFSTVSQQVNDVDGSLQRIV